MTSSQEKSFDCTPGVRGRYVNIRIAGKNKKLNICAVSVNPNPAGESTPMGKCKQGGVTSVDVEQGCS